MRLTIAAVGRLRDGPLKELFATYRQRCPWQIDVVEVLARRKLPAAGLRRHEADLLLDAVPDGAVIVALDEGGKGLDSRSFARRLSGWRDDGRREVAFVLGGADGLDGDVLRRADLKIAFGVMTWPHQLCRVMLMEQIYRASSILAGHPYHRD